MRRATLFLALAAVILTALLGMGATTDGTETAEGNTTTDNVSALTEEEPATLVKPVTVQVRNAAAYDITVEWGSLKFDYVKSQGVYEQPTGEWACEDGADTIVITNNSPMEIMAQFEYLKDDSRLGETVEGKFVDAENNNADNTPIAGNGTATVRLQLSGEVSGDTGDEAATLGNVILMLVPTDELTQ